MEGIPANQSPENINKNFQNGMNKNNMKEMIKFNPKNIELLNTLTKDSKIQYDLDNTFCAFKSINDLLYLIYVDKNNSIICYNILDNIKEIEIKKSHNKFISNFRHYLDSTNIRDLVMSISADDNNIKVWNINNFECITDIQKIYIDDNLLYSACFLNDNNNIFVITNAYFSNRRLNNEIKVYDLNGLKVKSIHESQYSSYFIDVYYDKQLNQNFIISGNDIQVISYDFKNNKIYKQYYEKIDRFDYDDNNQYHYSVYIYNKDNEVNLIESNCKCKIKIWDFHSAKLLSTINLEDFSGVFLLNDDYLYIGYDYGTIKIKKVTNGVNAKNLKSHKDKVLTIKKIEHPIYGECIISQSYSEIKLWVCNK